MWHVLENTSVRVLSPIVLYIDITVGNVFPEPIILCEVLSSREEPTYVCTMYICMYLKAR